MAKTKDKDEKAEVNKPKIPWAFGVTNTCCGLGIVSGFPYQDPKGYEDYDITGSLSLKYHQNVYQKVTLAVLSNKQVSAVGVAWLNEQGFECISDEVFNYANWISVWTRVEPGSIRRPGYKNSTVTESLAKAMG